MARVLIADNCEVVRSGVRGILEAQPDLQIVGEAADGEEAISNAIGFQPDVAIVEICLPARDGIAVTNHIRKHLPQTEVLIFTLHEEELWISLTRPPPREPPRREAALFVCPAEDRRTV